MKTIRTYKDLKVWQKAYGVAIHIIKIVDLLPHITSMKVIAEQISRSSTSVCANIAEGYGSNSNNEFARYLGISYKSALETDNWIQVLKGSNKIDDKNIIKELEEIEQDNLESIKMLLSLRKKVKQSNKKDKLQS